MTKGFRFLICPDCGKRGVHFVMPGGGTREDNWQCRYCPWYAYTLSHAERDTQHIALLKKANPQVEEW